MESKSEYILLIWKLYVISSKQQKCLKLLLILFITNIFLAYHSFQILFVFSCWGIFVDMNFQHILITQTIFDNEYNFYINPSTELKIAFANNVKRKTVAKNLIFLQAPFLWQLFLLTNDFPSATVPFLSIFLRSLSSRMDIEKMHRCI